MLSPHRQNPSAVIIGGGLGGLGTAALLARAGHPVTLLEKNPQVGGRANVFSADGFTFDMGPSWYLMPDVFERFFRLLGTTPETELDLVKLSPSYRLFFEGKRETLDLFADVDKSAALFNSLEPGAGAKLRAYLDVSRRQYDIIISSLMYKNASSFSDFIDWKMIKAGLSLPAFSSMHSYVARFFKTEVLQQIMQYQLLFLGSLPFHAPSLYNIMGHIDFNMGVYYPRGGIYTVVQAIRRIAENHGAVVRVNAPVRAITVANGRATGVELDNGERISADLVISNADIHHTETALLPAKARSFSPRYWQKRSLAPSALILYLGVRGRVSSMIHHNILFAKNWNASFRELFEGRNWPENPSLYVCCPSKSDAGVAPPECETMFVLMPIAAGLDYSEAIQQTYADRALDLIASHMGVPDLRERIAFMRIYCGNDFARDYNSFRGSALGLAHTLMQTAVFRPANVSKKLPNLFYAGAGTNPGIGMPSCLISAELAFKRIRGIRSGAPLASFQEPAAAQA